jgi:hypothetical protein
VNVNNQIIREIVRFINSNDMTWQEIADSMNEKFGLDFSESWYRKHYNNDWTCGNDIVGFGGSVDIENSENKEAVSEIEDVRIERKKLTDQIVQNNAILRRIAREQTIKEIAHEYAEKMNKEKILPVLFYASQKDERQSFGKVAILEISDWHYGIEISNPFNIYNPEVCQYRVSLLRDRVIDIVKKEGITTLYVANLSDMIAGRIHLPLRIQSRIDTITQIMEVSEILAEFLAEISCHCDIIYYDCCDNHSRLEPNKNESIDLESLTRVTKWYLKERMQKHTNVFIEDNRFGEDIISFKCCGHDVIGVHGHEDSVQSVISNLTMMTRQMYDLVLIAHKHHFSVDEQNETVVVANGSLMGTDEYAKKLRKSSKPSQNLIVVSEKNPVEVIYRIILE